MMMTMMTTTMRVTVLSTGDGGAWAWSRRRRHPSRVCAMGRRRACGGVRGTRAAPGGDVADSNAKDDDDAEFGRFDDGRSAYESTTTIGEVMQSDARSRRDDEGDEDGARGTGGAGFALGGSAPTFERRDADADPDARLRAFVSAGIDANRAASAVGKTTNGRTTTTTRTTNNGGGAPVGARGGDEHQPLMTGAPKTTIADYVAAEDAAEDAAVPAIRASSSSSSSSSSSRDETKGESQGWSGGGFDAPDGTVPLPLSYYQVLNMPATRVTPNAIPRAALAAIEAELPRGYSPNMLQARLSLIDEAAWVLKDEAARKQHDKDIRDGILTPIEPERAAAALCLLQEAGEYESVLEFGDVVAQCRGGRQHRKDVALTMALAFCEFGHMSLVSNPPRIVEGCDLLELGGETLSRAGGASFAPEVRRNINLTYHDMAPGYVLELLALPLEETSARALGLRALRSLLWTKDVTQQLEQRGAFMEQANELLTSQEQVSLFIEAPDYVPADTDEVYKSALAHVVAGLIQSKPMLIIDADEIFHQLQAAAERNGDGLADVGVERAVCQLLLGRVDEAAHTLGLYDGTADPALEQYVRERSQEGDLIEGMCAMADQWINDVAFPLFRDGAEVVPPSLEDWFATPNVQGFVTRLQSFSALIRIQGALEAGKRAVVNSIDSITSAFAPTPPVLEFGVSDTQRRVVAVAKLGVIGAAAYAAGGGSALSGVTLPKINPLAPVQAAGSAVVHVGSSLSKIQLPTISLPKPSPKLAPKAEPKKATTKAAAVAAPKVIASTPKKVTPVMDASLAEKVVRKWQTAKAQALGHSHNTRHLGTILEGPMLQQWETRAEDVASHGWAWEYQLNALSIDNINIVSEDRVFVETTLTELAVLKDKSRNEPDDVYESTYRAKYELKRCESGGVKNWKIVGGSVVY